MQQASARLLFLGAVCRSRPAWRKDLHDHVDLVFTATTLRFRDPRRFGTLLWHEGSAIENHPLIAVLGIEPLTDAFNGDWLYDRTRRRSGRW